MRVLMQAILHAWKTFWRPECRAVGCKQIAAERVRKEDEARQREAADRERRAAEDAEDRAAANQRAVELRESVAFHRHGTSPGS